MNIKLQDMIEFLKTVYDVIKIKSAYSDAKRKARWYSWLSLSKWGKLYLIHKMTKDQNRSQL